MTSKQGFVRSADFLPYIRIETGQIIIQYSSYIIVKLSRFLIISSSPFYTFMVHSKNSQKIVIGVLKKRTYLPEFGGGGGGTVVNFWPPCGNSPTVQNVYILVQFVSKID